MQTDTHRIEQGIIASFLKKNTLLSSYNGMLKSDDFSNENNKQIFDALSALYLNGISIDKLSIKNSLREKGINYEELLPYLSYIEDKAFTEDELNYYVDLVISHRVKSDLLKLMNESSNHLHETGTDPKTILKNLCDSANQLNQSLSNAEFTSLASCVKNSLLNIEKRLKFENEPRGILTGLKELDKSTTGFKKGEFIVIGGRPGMGKSGLMLTMLLNMGRDQNIPAAYFSIEMSNEMISNRLLSMTGQLSSGKINKAQLEEHEFLQLIERSNKLYNAPIFIDDHTNTIDDLLQRINNVVTKHKVEVVFIDYLQLIGKGQYKFHNRDQELASICRRLKILARDLNIVIITSSQLNRSVETRGGAKKPQLSDLRESGSIEQDADKVIFIYRPDYYGMEGADPSYTPDMAELIIAKNRNGALEIVQVRFIDRFAMFTDQDSGPDFTQIRKEEFEEPF